MQAITNNINQIYYAAPKWMTSPDPSELPHPSKIFFDNKLPSKNIKNVKNKEKKNNK